MNRNQFTPNNDRKSRVEQGCVVTLFPAGGYHGYSDEYKAATVNFGPKAVIYEAVADSSTMDTDSISTIAVTTDQSITSVSFSGLNGIGRMSRTHITSYRYSGAFRYWENTFYSGSTDGIANILITATQDSGASVSKTVWVTATTPWYVAAF